MFMWSAAHVTIPDYTALIAPDCTPWHGVAVYNRAATHVREFSQLFLRLLVTVVPLSWRWIMKTVAI